MRSVVIVVLVFVGGMGLLIPAIQKVRESSRRLQTNNNLKECALAVHSYHDKFNKLPNAFGPGGDHESDVSMWIHLLPFVGQENAYRAAMVDVVVPAYQAPSDAYVSRSAGVVNFAANLRLFANKSVVNPNGIDVAMQLPETDVPLLSGLKLQGIADGTTNTIMLTTRYGSCAGQTTWYAADVVGKRGLAPFPAPGVGGFVGAGRYSTPPTQKDTPLTAIYQLAPTETDCIPQGGLFGHSFQITGMSIALADSAVRNVSPTMPPLTYLGALCPGDGSPVPSGGCDDD